MKTFNPFKPGLLFVLLAIVAAGCAKPAADKPTLEGRWSGFEGGSTEALTLEFTGNRFAYWDSQTNEIGSGTFIGGPAESASLARHRVPTTSLKRARGILDLSRVLVNLARF